MLLVLLCLPAGAWEHDPNSPYKGWADKQQVMEAAKSRFSCGVGGNCSCCDGSEIVKTKYRCLHLLRLVLEQKRLS